ncbi:endo alpha-1,4 polygalactosaminidase [Candidatus Electronema sp. PJ]|uniref:endo alpha-1,4 polygalactosaminidase n=1 Tax=Candidatus Electronema sp. PJ TaxID=3401572 RepID=UPI003AA99A01
MQAVITIILSVFFFLISSSAYSTTFFVGKIPVVIEKNEFYSGMTGYIQLQGDIQDKNVSVYDIDLEDNAQSGLFSQLKNKGIKVVCYFSAGTYEDWRSDKDQFAADILGNNLAEWPGERWVDIRSATTRAIMAARMDRAASAGCDAVDPDNVDGYQNDSGFLLTEADQIDYLHWLAKTAHSKGLKVGLKNAVGLIQVGSLAQHFDFTINESCYDYQECGLLKPFIEKNKWVFILQYDAAKVPEYCSAAQNDKYFLAFFNKELDGATYLPCP